MVTPPLRGNRRRGAAGVIFQDENGEGPGVRLRKKKADAE